MCDSLENVYVIRVAVPETVSATRGNESLSPSLVPANFSLSLCLVYRLVLCTRVDCSRATYRISVPDGGFIRSDKIGFLRMYGVSEFQEYDASQAHNVGN